MKKFSMVVLCCCIAMALAIAPSAIADTFTADTYNFTFTGTVDNTSTNTVGYGDLVTLNGTFTTSTQLGVSSDGGFQIVSASGYFTDLGDTYSGNVSILGNSVTNIYSDLNFACGGNSTCETTYENSNNVSGDSLSYEAGNELGSNNIVTWSPDGWQTYDNLYYPGGSGPGVSPSGTPFDQFGLLLALSGPGVPSGFELNFFQDTAGIAQLWESDSSGYYNDSFGSFTFSNVAGAPEPSSLLLLGTGLFGLAFVALRRAKSAARPPRSLSRT